MCSIGAAKLFSLQIIANINDLANYWLILSGTHLKDKSYDINDIKEILRTMSFRNIHFYYIDI